MHIRTVCRLATAALLITITTVELAEPAQSSQRTAKPKPPVPMTLRQVIESLSSLRNSRRVEDLVAKAGVQFQATDGVVDILKQFGAGPKLISMIPVPPPPPPPPPRPQPPPPPIAGPLSVVCEPADCAVVVDDKFHGATKENRATFTGLDPGETTVHVFAEGYEHVTRLIVLDEGKPAEARFSLERTAIARQESARALLLRTVTNLGGIDGLAELADIEGEGRMQWTNSSGVPELWTVTFNKRVGKDLAATFKSVEGDCTASVLAQAAKQECKGGLRNRGEKIAAQAASLFLSYQLQDVIHALLERPLITAEGNENRVESFDSEDSYVLTIGREGLPTDLVYRLREGDSPIHLQYSNYLSLGKGQYPGRISVGRLDGAPSWVFTLSRVRSRVAGRAK